MEKKKMLERLRRYEEAVSRARKEKQKREEEETNRSVLSMLHSHERGLGTGGGCLR